MSAHQPPHRLLDLPAVPLPDGSHGRISFLEHCPVIENPSGLDYKKMVLIKDERYVGTAAIIDVDEFKEVRDNLDAIVAGAVKYIDTYAQHANKSCILHDREYRRLFQYSTLSYFHDILGI